MKLEGWQSGVCGLARLLALRAGSDLQVSLGIPYMRATRVGDEKSGSQVFRFLFAVPVFIRWRYSR